MLQTRSLQSVKKRFVAFEALIPSSSPGSFLDEGLWACACRSLPVRPSAFLDASPEASGSGHPDKKRKKKAQAPVLQCSELFLGLCAGMVPGALLRFEVEVEHLRIGSAGPSRGSSVPRPIASPFSVQVFHLRRRVAAPAPEISVTRRQLGQGTAWALELRRLLALSTAGASLQTLALVVTSDQCFPVMA